MKGRKLTEAQIEDAIIKTNGILAATARTLKVSRATIHKYVNKSEKLQQATHEAREALIDFAESKLVANIKSRDTTSIIFFLKTQGHKRGYGKQEHYQEETSQDRVELL